MGSQVRVLYRAPEKHRSRKTSVFFALLRHCLPENAIGAFPAGGAVFCYTSPIKYSTAMATTTTSAEMMKPWIMGAMPDFRISLKLVFRPIAASADTMRNLLTSFMQEETRSGMTPRLLTAVRARNPKINHGIIAVILRSTVAGVLPR